MDQQTEKERQQNRYLKQQYEQFRVQVKCSKGKATGNERLIQALLKSKRAQEKEEDKRANALAKLQKRLSSMVDSFRSIDRPDEYSLLLERLAKVL